MRKTLIIVFALVAGCSRVITPPVTVTAKKDLVGLRVQRLAVLPAGMALDAGPVAPRAAEIVTEILLDASAREPRWTLVDSDALSAALRSVPEGDRADSRAAAVASKVGADAALATTIKRFRERVGSDYGATEPASVTIEMILVSPRDRAVLWKADYAFTQEPLTYNLWNFWTVMRGGPRWLTAAELARIGVEEALLRLERSLASP